ncbi:MAG: type III-B CRISPR module RAMP protein Cmr6 [Armatimonadetes bacterium]|nr:type III-B CRISPR module RAMP protein Cmr6 [Armatimonadota bacterium]
MSNGVKARRSVLENLKPTAETHAGLLLQRYLTAHKPKQRDNTQDTPEEQLLEQARVIAASKVYCAAFQRWNEFAQRTPNGCARVHFTVQAAAPIAVGLGDASPLEVGIRLHHTYGMPLLPASALKGLCRRVARLLRHDSKLSDEAIDALFGFSRDTQAAAGAGVFYDAWYDPDSVGGAPFHRDVITVHHPAYYGSGEVAPTDFDDPTPVPFLVIKPGARFLCVLDAPNRQWADFAQKMLLWGLENLGVGAKTNAGYGYLNREGGASASPAARPTLQASEQVWQQAHITYDAGKQTLTVQNLATKARAEAQGAQAKTLLDALPDAVRQQLVEKRKLTADVVVEQQGNMRRLVKILAESAR